MGVGAAHLGVCVCVRVRACVCVCLLHGGNGCNRSCVLLQSCPCCWRSWRLSQGGGAPWALGLLTWVHSQARSPPMAASTLQQPWGPACMRTRTHARTHTPTLTLTLTLALTLTLTLTLTLALALALTLALTL